MSWKSLGMSWNASRLFVLAILHLSLQDRVPDDKSQSYIAAVVEYSPYLTDGNSLSTLNINSNAYVKFIEQASQKKADIIVFPEDGLTTLSLPDRTKMNDWATLVPSPSSHFVPCTDTNFTVSQALQKLSCAAKKNRIYVVVNIAEKSALCDDKKCSLKAMHYFNTNVVFDRTGKIIARYRKTHLFIEPQFDTLKKPDFTTFDTDFGVTFGTFTCFDMLFHEPSLTLSRNLGVKDFVYTTAWFSEVPFLTAVQAQFGWAFSENVNFLVAGYNRPQYGSTGSGIYLGRKGVGQSVMTGNLGSQLLISRVPKIRQNGASKTRNEITAHVPERWDNVNRISLMTEDLKSYSTLPINGSISTSLCNGRQCCSFTVKTRGVDKTNHYRIVVYDGTRIFGRTVLAGISVCGLVQCGDATANKCGTIKNSTITFTKLQIIGVFRDYKDNLIMPSMLSSSLLPFNDFNYVEYPRGNNTEIVASLNKPMNNLATFSIYSRVFNRDGKKSPF